MERAYRVVALVAFASILSDATRLADLLHFKSFYGTLYALETSMNLETNIRPISYIKTNAADMIRQINDTRNPIVITQNGEAKGVLIDPRSYQEMIDALGIMKLLAQSEKAIETGNVQSHQKVMEAARRLLKTT